MGNKSMVKNRFSEVLRRVFASREAVSLIGDVLGEQAKFQGVYCRGACLIAAEAIWRWAKPACKEEIKPEILVFDYLVEEPDGSESEELHVAVSFGEVVVDASGVFTRERMIERILEHVPGADSVITYPQSVAGISSRVAYYSPDVACRLSWLLREKLGAFPDPVSLHPEGFVGAPDIAALGC